MTTISAIKAISLGDLVSNAERILLGARSFSAAGLAVNAAAAQTNTVTVGAKHTGDVLTVTVNGTPYAYTVLVTDADNAAVATALAAVIDADADVEAAAVGAVITVTASVASAAFTITEAVTGTGATTTLALATTHTSVQKVLTANTLNYCIDGAQYAASATANIAVGGAVLPISSFRWYLVSVAADASMTVYPSTDNVAVLPDLAAGSAPVGAFKVVTDATHTFTPGTTPLNGAGITTTYFDLSSMPVAGLPA